MICNVSPCFSATSLIQKSSVLCRVWWLSRWIKRGLQDQGKAFPYSFGLHLGAQIVAAFNPHDLDAMDESLPFTKQVLDNLLGYQSSPEEYRYYFDCFIEAQKKLPLERFQHDFVKQLPTLYSQFMELSVATDIPAAARYKQQVK